MSKAFRYGLYYIQIGFRDSNGYFKGQQSTPDSVADNTTSHSYVCFNPVSFEHPSPTRTEWTDFGGQSIRAQKLGGVETLGSGTFTLSEYDNTLHSMIASTAVDSSTVTDWEQTPSNINAVNLPAFFLVVSTKSQIVNDTTGAVTDAWSHDVYPNVQIAITAPNASQSGGVNPQPVQFTFTPSFSGRRLDGRTFLLANPTVVGARDMRYNIKSDYPLAATMYTKDAIATSFILGYRPKASTATGVLNNSITNNGVTEAVTSVSTTTGVVTMSAAGTATHIVNVLYETEYVAI